MEIHPLPHNIPLKHILPPQLAIPPTQNIRMQPRSPMTSQHTRPPLSRAHNAQLHLALDGLGDSELAAQEGHLESFLLVAPVGEAGLEGVEGLEGGGCGGGSG